MAKNTGDGFRRGAVSSQTQFQRPDGQWQKRDESNGQPTLIVHGSDDTMFPSINAYEMFKNMSGATLVMYPDSGHGALFQYPKTFTSHVRTFLNA